MGVALSRSEDGELYREAYEEAQRIIRISDEVRMSLEKVAKEETPSTGSDGEEGSDLDKLTSSKLAKKLGLGTQDLLDRLVAAGHLELKDGKHYLTESGKAVGGEFRMSKRFGPYFLWPSSLVVE